MCTCGQVEREEQQHLLTNSLPDRPVDTETTTCHSEPSPILLRLDVTDAVDAGEGRFWEVVHNTNTIKLRAVTDPDDESAWGRLAWEGNGLQGGSGPNRKVISRSAVRNGEVTVRLGGTAKSAEIHVIDLTALTSTLLEISSQEFKTYAVASTTTVLQAATNPDRAEAWGLIEWTGGTDGDTDRQRKVDTSAVGDVTVTAKLGRLGPKQIQAVVHVCQWPELEVKEITFSGTDRHTVEKDATGDFDNKWIKGRNQNAQSPLCYTRNKKVELSAVFTVKTKPTYDEKVKIRASASFGGTRLEWLSTGGHLDVLAAASEVTLTATLSDNAIPDAVDCYDPLTITWEMSTHDDKWKTIGTTDHLFYAVLGAPNGSLAYWTLIDYSCRAAHGKSSPNDVVTELFQKLKTTTGDGNGLLRKRDGVELSYYKQGVQTPGSGVFQTADLLSRSDGTARCGAWANFMVSTCQVHGITTAQVISAVPITNEASVFLVQRCTFNGNGTGTVPFPHKGQTECVKQDGLAGQGKTNPQFIFGDHALVSYGGRIYDPSYGAGPYADLKAWEDAGIAGLGKGGYTAFVHSGVQQAIPKECSKGFIVHTVNNETMDQIATNYGITDGATLYGHAFNAALRALRTGGPGTVQNSDKVYIPREISTTAAAAITKQA